MLVDVMRALGRRWYVIAVGLLMTIGLAYGAYATTPPEYTARGLVLLLPSEIATGEAGNPFLALGGLEQPAGIVVAYFASESAKSEVAEESATAEYLVAIDDSTRGPVISVNVTDVSADDALSTLSFLMERIPAELARLQQDVEAPSDATITSMTLTMDTEANVDRSGMVRMVIAATAVGLLITGAVAFALDGLLLRRRQRRNAAKPADDSSAASSPEDPDAPEGPEDPFPMVDEAARPDDTHADELDITLETDETPIGAATRPVSARNRQ